MEPDSSKVLRRRSMPGTTRLTNINGFRDFFFLQKLLTVEINQWCAREVQGKSSGTLCSILELMICQGPVVLLTVPPLQWTTIGVLSGFFQSQNGNSNWNWQPFFRSIVFRCPCKNLNESVSTFGRTSYKCEMRLEFPSSEKLHIRRFVDWGRFQLLENPTWIWGIFSRICFLLPESFTWEASHLSLGTYLEAEVSPALVVDSWVFSVLEISYRALDLELWYHLRPD